MSAAISIPEDGYIVIEFYATKDGAVVKLEHRIDLFEWAFSLTEVSREDFAAEKPEEARRKQKAWIKAQGFDVSTGVAQAIAERIIETCEEWKKKARFPLNANSATPSSTDSPSGDTADNSPPV